MKIISLRKENRHLKMLSKIVEEKRKEEEGSDQLQEQTKQSDHNSSSHNNEENTENLVEDNSNTQNDNYSVKSDENIGVKKQKKRKAKKSKPKKKKIRVKNKFFENLYEEEKTDPEDSETAKFNGEFEAPLNEVDFDIDENDVKHVKKELKFNRLLNSVKKHEDPVILANLWNKYSKNKLAEMGINTKIKIHSDDFENDNINQTWASEDHKEESKVVQNFDTNIIEQEIEFVDPERLKKEQIEKEEKDNNIDGKIIAPITMGKSLTKTKRSQYLQLLRFRNRKIASLEEIGSMHKQTTLMSKRKITAEDLDNEELRRILLEEAQQFLNNEQWEGEDQNEEYINFKRLLELEGDWEEDSDYVDQESEENESEESGKNDNCTQSQHSDNNLSNSLENNDNIDQEHSDLVDINSITWNQSEFKEKDQEEKCKSLYERIRQRKIAMKYFDNEAELGSDNEENDDTKRNINTEDYEEILDKKLELEDQNLKGLIDDSKTVEPDNNTAAKFVEISMKEDHDDTVNVIKAITYGFYNKPDKASIDEETKNSISFRMRQKQQEKMQKEQEKICHNDIKNRVMKVWEKENFDEDETKDMIAEEFRRKIKKTIRSSKLQSRFKPHLKYIWDNPKTTILESNNNIKERGKINKMGLLNSSFRLVGKLNFK